MMLFDLWTPQNMFKSQIHSLNTSSDLILILHQFCPWIGQGSLSGGMSKFKIEQKLGAGAGAGEDRDTMTSIRNFGLGHNYTPIK